MIYAVISAAFVGSVSAWEAWCNPIPGPIRPMIPACGDDPGDDPFWCQAVPAIAMPYAIGCHAAPASSVAAPVLQTALSPLETIMMEVEKENTASSTHWCMTMAASIRATIPACAGMGSGQPDWCLTIPASVRHLTYGCEAPASSVMAPVDSVIVSAPQVQVSNALFGAGDKAPGETCSHQFMGSECQSGSMCMVLGGKSFCTALNSLPEGMECANTGNAVQTFCAGGMTCCSGKCVDAIACASGKMDQVQKITATAFEIYSAYQKIAGASAASRLATAQTNTVMLQEPEVQVSNALFGSGGKTAGEECSWQFFGSECESNFMCMELAGRGICTALGSLPLNMECANTGNAIQTFCGAGMTCCSGQCADLVECAQGKWDQAQKIIATAQEVYAAAQAIGVV